jgi:putative ABC transport system permease protein
MLAPRWKKVVTDFFANKTRTFLTIITIAIGVFAVGLVTNAFTIMLGDMETTYRAVNPHSGVVYTMPFDDDMLETVLSMPEVGSAEGKATYTARILTGPEQKKTISFTGISDLEKMQIDKIQPAQKGERISLEDKEVLIERSSVPELKIKPGDSIRVEVEKGQVRELLVSGIVADPTSPPYQFTGQVQAFVNPTTMEWLGGSKEYSQLLFIPQEQPYDEAHVTRVGKAIADKLEKSGRLVFVIYTTEPGKHWAASITQALGIILGALGVLAVFLSAFLVVNTITALLSQHIRQIGVMKAVGARGGQIIAMYFGLVISFGLIALAIAVPLAGWVGYELAVGMSSFLNYSVQGFRIPTLSLVLQTIIALGVPLIATTFPVLTGTRITIREAISNYGLGAGQFGKSLFDRVLEKIRFLSRPLLISLRNTFRKKARLLLTIFTLTLGGAIFISVMNLQASFDVLIPKVLGYFLSDVNVSFSQPIRMARVESIIRHVPGIEEAEGWLLGVGEVLSSDKETGVRIFLVAPPSGSRLIKADMREGRWLMPGDENAIVIGNHLLAKMPNLKVGDNMTIKINNKEQAFRIVGIFQMAGNMPNPILYTNYEYLARLQNMSGQAMELRLVTAAHDGASQSRIAKMLESAFKRAGIPVSDINTGADITQQNLSTINIIVYMLLVMALLIALVGGIGLMGTMSINVMERTREIGVMRAIGAKDFSVFEIVVVEGMLIGIISWGFGILLAIPISSLLSYAVGTSMMQAPMDSVFSIPGLIAWLVLVLLLSAVASALPARNAMALTIREVLAYE